MKRLFLAFVLAAIAGCANLRAASSGEVGCPASEIAISDDSGPLGNSRTWVAECRGRVFYCSAHATGESEQYSCTESAAPDEIATTADTTANEPSAELEPKAQPAPKHLPPKEAVGFSLSASQASAEESCVGAGHEWVSQEEAFTCSGTPVSVGNDATARLAFCGEKLCDLTIFVTFDGADEEADPQLLAILKVLREKYGTPARNETGGTAYCRSQGLVRCTASGAAFVERKWEWAGGERIFLRFKGKDGKATLTVRYLTQKLPTPGASAF